MPKYHHSETGCVFVRDNNGHWFFIPATMLSTWNMLVNQDIPDMYIHTGEEFDDAFDRLAKQFENYRLPGGLDGIVVHSWHYGDKK